MKTKPRKNERKFEKVTVGNVTVKIYEYEQESSNGKPRKDFLISDYTTGARRLRWFADHAEARAEAEKIARQLSTGETTAAMMRNSEAASYGRAIELGTTPVVWTDGNGLVWTLANGNGWVLIPIPEYNENTVIISAIAPSVSAILRRCVAVHDPAISASSGSRFAFFILSCVTKCGDRHGH
jgi:hypothetical protein